MTATYETMTDWGKAFGVYFFAFLAAALMTCASTGCAHFETVVDFIDPQLARCEQIEDREARAECIAAIVDSVEDALEIARDLREMSR